MPQLLHPRLRQFVLERGSSLTLNLRYHRQITSFDRRVITAMELLCFLRAAAIPLAVFTGAAPLSRIPLLYAMCFYNGNTANNSFAT